MQSKIRRILKMRKGISKLILSVIALVLLSSCSINFLVMVGGYGEKDPTGKYILKYKPSKIEKRNDFCVRINIPDTVSCRPFDCCRHSGEETDKGKTIADLED